MNVGVIQIMKFAIIGHLINERHKKLMPKEYFHHNMILSPEFDIQGTKGYITGITLTAKQMMNFDLHEVRKKILKNALFLQNNYHVNLIQLGGLTTSVTHGGTWLVKQEKYAGFVNHGDSYTVSVTCEAVKKSIEYFKMNSSNLTLAIVGAYGIIGEAVSKILTPQFSKTYLVGRREKKLQTLAKNIHGNFTISTNLAVIKKADVVVTATNHPSALLHSHHLRQHAIVIDVSQPPNLSSKLCKQRPDVNRIDGGYVDFPEEYKVFLPGIPHGKLYACIVEVIMQALENEHGNHVGSIEMDHIKKTEKWAKKYGFTLNELTNFGKIFSIK